MIAARGPAAKPARVFDDAVGGSVLFTGDWQRKSGIAPAHAGTLTCSNRKRATAELVFEGSKVLWFTKLGPDCGKAEVSLDGGCSRSV